MEPNPTDNGEEKTWKRKRSEKRRGRTREDEYCGTRLGYRWTGDTEEDYKEGGVSKKGMTSKPDSDYIEPRHISLARLMSDTSPVTPRVRLTLTSANQPRPLTQNSIYLPSVTTSEPLSPPPVRFPSDHSISQSVSALRYYRWPL
jgi:hypothetical protein